MLDLLADRRLDPHGRDGGRFHSNSVLQLRYKDHAVLASPHQSMLIFAAFATSAHFTRLACTVCLNWAGVSMRTVLPCASNFSRISGCSSTARIAALSLSTMRASVPLG